MIIWDIIEYIEENELHNDINIEIIQDLFENWINSSENFDKQNNLFKLEYRIAKQVIQWVELFMEKYENWVERDENWEFNSVLDKIVYYKFDIKKTNENKIKLFENFYKNIN